jgi:hypothetical protein
VHLIMNYDFKIQNEQAKRSFFWTTIIIPRFSSKTMLRKRNNVESEVISKLASE